LLFDETDSAPFLRFTFLLQSDERRRVRRLFSAIAHGESSLLREQISESEQRALLSPVGRYVMSSASLLQQFAR
jgi:hypothetical protein